MSIPQGRGNLLLCNYQRLILMRTVGVAPRVLIQLNHSVKTMKKIKFLKRYLLSWTHFTARTTLSLTKISLIYFRYKKRDSNPWFFTSFLQNSTFVTLTFPRNRIKSPKQLMDASLAEFFAKTKTASFADVQKLVPFIAVVVYACWNERRGSEKGKTLRN